MRWYPRAARAAAGLLLLALGACSSSGENPFQRLGQVARTALSGPEGAPPAELTRAELDAIPYATIAVSLGRGPRAYLVPLADNGGYLDYLDAGGRGVVMFGNAVVRTLALGADLEGVRHDRRDPLAYPRPLAEWPPQLWREYRYRLRDGAAYSIALNCTYQRVAEERIEIVELFFDVVRVAESCTNARRQVVNTYWVEADSGFVWKSEQWVGPELGHLVIEVIRPYAGATR